MARINKEQRALIEAQFRVALTNRCNASIPKDLVNKKVKVKFTGYQTLSLKLGTPGRYVRTPYTIGENDYHSDVKVEANALAKRMKDAVRKAETIKARGEALWGEIEQEMILGSDDIKQTLTNALTKVAKL